MNKVKSYLHIRDTFQESVLCLFTVFVIGYLHHLYFSYDRISPTFVACSLLSAFFVMAYHRLGFLISSFFQLGFILWVLLDDPTLFLEQCIFSTSVVASLAALLLSQNEPAQAQVSQAEPAQAAPKIDEISREQDSLKQELFDARKEITSLYKEKELLLDTIRVQSVEKESSIALLQERLDAALLEKRALYEEKEDTEADIAKLIGDIHDLSLERASERASKPKLQPFEAMYKQLREQFSEKSQVLDTKCHELFQAQEIISELRCALLEYQTQDPTIQEKALHAQLVKTQKKLDSLKKSSEEERKKLEEVILSLLNQLATSSQDVPRA